MLCKKKATIFNIYGRKNLHIKPSDQSSGLLLQTFDEVNNLYLYKSKVTTIKKGKIFNFNLNITYFTIHCVNLMIFLYLVLNLDTSFKKCDISLHIEKAGGGIMMLAIMLVGSRNYGRSVHRKTQVRRSILKQRKRIGKLFTQPNVRQKGKDLETTCRRIIRNLMCLRIQRGWMLLVNW